MKRPDAGIKEFDLKGTVFDLPLLPDELIHPRLSNHAAWYFVYWYPAKRYVMFTELSRVGRIIFHLA